MLLINLLCFFSGMIVGLGLAYFVVAWAAKDSFADWLDSIEQQRKDHP